MVSSAKTYKSEIIGCKWVYPVKYNYDDIVQRYKAPLVAKGYYQTIGCDFKETLSSIVKPITVCAFLT